MDFSREITDFVNAHREEYLADLAELIRIPSVSFELFEASEDAPFGTHCVRALDEMLALCRKYGLETRKIGNVIGIAEYGEGERELDIVAHLDVQPAGPGWKTPPFELTVDGDTAYGRGVSDDKGPALAALYAVRALKENGIALSKKVRLVFGTGEEYGIQDIHYYTDVELQPPFMFTPDHSFPIVNTNKAGYVCDISAKFDDEGGDVRVISVHSGDNRGAVPGECSAVICGADAEFVRDVMQKTAAKTGLPFTMSEDGENITLRCTGVSTHAVKADYGKSALTAMLELVCALPLADTAAHRALRNISKLFPHGDVAGRSCGLYCEDEASGGSLYNVGIFRFDSTSLLAQQRATLPASRKFEEYAAFFRSVVEPYGFTVSEERFADGRHIPLTDPYVAKLLESYEQHMSEKAFGIAVGGGCYAGAFEHGVAFGCEPYGVDTRMHGAQEFISIDHMMKTTRVYAQAVLSICR